MLACSQTIGEDLLHLRVVLDGDVEVLNVLGVVLAQSEAMLVVIDTTKMLN